MKMKTLERNSQFKILTIAVLLSASQISQADLITNGSFESGGFVDQGSDTMLLNIGATAMTGWTVVSNTLAWIGPLNPYSLTASSGNYFLDFTVYSNSAPFGGVSQTIATTPGQFYQLSFDLGSSNIYGRPTAILASAGLTSDTFTSALSGGNSDWQHETLAFTASSRNTTISLVGSGGGGHAYIGLDNVSVIAVPEPEEWAMMLLGAGMVGFQIKRKQKQL